jgi:alpha-1,2-mannosyltransferase
MQSDIATAFQTVARWNWISRRWICHAIVVSSLATLSLSFLHNARGSQFLDFEAYFAGAMAVKNGEPLYARALVTRDAEYTSGHPTKREPEPGLPYVYLPPAALALVPLTVLPFSSAAVLWRVLSYGTLALTSFLLVRLLLPLHPELRLPAALILCVVMAVFQPIRASLNWGQIDIVLLLFVTLSMTAFVDRRDLIAGLWLGLALLVKPFLGFLVLYFVWKRSLTAVVASCLTPILVLGASLVVVDPRNLIDYLGVMSYWSGPIWSVSPGNQSPYGFLLRLFTVNPFTMPIADAPWIVSVARVALAGVVLITFTILLSRSRQLPATQQWLEFGLMIVGMLLISPTAQAGHYAYLVVPFVALAATGGAFGWQRAGTLALVAGLWAYLSIPGLRAWSFGQYAYHQGPLQAPALFLTGAHLYALCILAFLVAVVIYRERRVMSP